MMEIPPTRTAPDETPRDPIRSEHAALRACADRLGHALARMASGAARPAEGADALQLLADFRRRLLGHLANEERSGLLEHASDREPRFHGRVATLRGEHGEIRARAEALVAEAYAAGWDAVHAHFLDFRRFLDAHEHAETDVLLRAHLEDLGGGG